MSASESTRMTGVNLPEKTRILARIYSLILSWEAPEVKPAGDATDSANEANLSLDNRDSNS